MADRKHIRGEISCTDIILAAISIAKENGWETFSMRKLAERTGYSLPTIYNSFPGKNELMTAVAKSGFQKLTLSMSERLPPSASPSRQLQQIWLAYWKFAFSEKELYQLMFGINLSCRECRITTAAGDFLAGTRAVLEKMTCPSKQDSSAVRNKSYTLWSMVHGLISLSFIKQNRCFESSTQLITDAIAIFASG